MANIHREIGGSTVRPNKNNYEGKTAKAQLEGPNPASWPVTNCLRRVRGFAPDTPISFEKLNQTF